MKHIVMPKQYVCASFNLNKYLCFSFHPFKHISQMLLSILSYSTTILSLVRCLVKKFILFTFCRQEHWSVRKTSRVRSDGSNHEEELYYKDRTVIWSRGHSTTASRLQKTITTEHPILQVH